MKLIENNSYDCDFNAPFFFDFRTNTPLEEK